MKQTVWVLFGFFAIVIGLYPLVYLLAPEVAQQGFLNTKGPVLLASILWNTAFYIHIGFGGLALLIGWTQFSKKIRNRRMNLHRTLGKIYVGSVLLSSIASIGIGFVANGGWISQAGFVSLGIVWLVSTMAAYVFIRNKEVSKHKKAMIYSYAACFAAVTLRIYLLALPPFFADFLDAYRIIAWLCWVPNIIIAYFIVNRLIPESKLVLE